MVTQEQLKKWETFKLENRLFSIDYPYFMAFVVDEKTQTIRMANEYQTGCRDYFKYVAIAHNTNPNIGHRYSSLIYPLAKDYVAVAITTTTNVKLLNLFEQEFNIQPTKVIVANSSNRQDFVSTLCFGDPIWYKSVELLSLYCLLLRGFRGTKEPELNQTFKQYVANNHYWPREDINTFINKIYPQLDSLQELHQFGLIDADISDTADFGYFDGAYHSFTGILSAFKSPADMYLLGDLTKLAPRLTFKYYNYFKEKAQKQQLKYEGMWKEEYLND